MRSPAFRDRVDGATEGLEPLVQPRHIPGSDRADGPPGDDQGCSGVDSASGTSPTKPTGGGSTVSLAPVAQLAPLACGEQFQPPAPGPLSLTAHFSATARLDRQSVTGSVEATAGAAVHGLGPGRSGAFLVREGGVVTLPAAQDFHGLIWDLSPGGVRTVPAAVSLLSCEEDTALLTPGAYDAFVWVALTTDEGTPMESFGDPWPLQV